MRYRDRAVVSTIAASMVPLVQAYKSGSTELQRYYAQIINLMCRKLENFVEPRVSKRACEKAKSLGLQIDLRLMHWDDQPGKMKDPGRLIFHWDHVVPVENIRREILELPNPSREAIEKIIERADIAWILKCENDALNQKGYRYKRDDPLACYSECDISFCEPPQ